VSAPDYADSTEAEIELLRLVGGGDRAAFSQLYDRFHGVLFGTAYRIVNNRETAEDVLQEVFIQIWEKAPLYDPCRGKPLTWAITLTRNKAIDRLRSGQRRARLQDQVEEQAKSDAQFDEQDGVSGLDLAENARTVRAALAKLPAEQREAIELAFFSGLTQTEISDRLGQPLGTVKARIRRGMMRLRSALERRED
jgi:RNA polymerase sigma-70 factor (ECF subfamily)